MKRCFPISISLCAVLLVVGAGWVVPAWAQESDNRNILWSVDWSADGRFFAVGGAWVGVFDAKTNIRRSTPALESLEAIAKVRWHPRLGLLALAGGKDGVTGIYDPAVDRITPLPSSEGTRGIAWNRTGELVATAGNQGELQIWSARGRLLHTTRPEHAKSLTGTAWSPTADQIVSVGEFLTLYDGEGRIIKQVRHRPDAKGMVLLLCVEWHPSGEFMAVGDYGNREAGDAPMIQFWSADLEKRGAVDVKGGAAFRNVSWNRDGSLLASASDALRIWSRDGRLMHEGNSPDPLWGVGWNRTGDRILTSSHDGRVDLWTDEARILQRVAVRPERRSAGRPSSSP